MNQDKIKSTLLKASRGAAKLLTASLQERRVIAKKSELSLVTETDEKAEALVIQTIRNVFSDHAILAEESQASGNSPHRWIIDPLDGTTNFSHTFPVAAVSIAYEENGVVQMGAVNDPFRDELFFAAKGQGAFLNDKPIAVSGTEKLNDSLLATGFPYDRRERLEDYLRPFRDFMKKTQGIRRTGAAAIDLCYVACGRFDGFWELKLNPWDVAAASLIVSEAGGRLSDFGGGHYTINHLETLASNSLIHKEMLSILETYHERLSQKV